MTKRTGMRAVERLNNRSTQRRVLRVINDHGRPCDRLQRDPVQTNRQTKCADRSDPTSTSKHDYEASYDIRDVNEAIRHIDSGTPLSGRVRRGFQVRLGGAQFVSQQRLADSQYGFLYRNK